MGVRLSGRALTMIAFDRNLTFKEIAEAAGVSKESLYAIKGGKRCRIETAQKIANALKVTVEEIQE